jgi:hypothetical protein
VAVAGVAGNGCIIAFNPTASMSALNNGSGAVKLDACSIYVNSSNAQGFTNNGSGSFSADNINLVAAGYLNNGTGTVTGTVNLRLDPIADPYADVPMPAPPAGCDYPAKKTATTTETFDPGPDGMMTFCKGVTLPGIGQTYTFLPGIYFVMDGDFLMSGINSTLVANGVTFVLTKTSGGSYATAVINGINQTLTMSAPTSGATAGLIFFQDRGAPAGGTNTINGKANVSTLTGALYFRRQTVLVNGVGQSTGVNCTQVLADQVKFNGAASTFGVNCPGAGVRAIGGFQTALVE